MELFAPPRAFNCADPVEDLGNLFVIDPGFMKGNILLEGPDCGTGTSCIQMISKANALDSCSADHFWYREPYVAANGWGGAQGVVYGSIKGQAVSPTLWSGSYEMWLGAPNRAASSTWSPGFLTLLVDHPSGPTAGKGYIQIHDRLPTGLAGSPNVQAGTTYIHDHAYCFSEIEVTFANPSGVLIGSSSVGTPARGEGIYIGPDPVNPVQMANYTVNAGFGGTPLVPGYTTGNATVRMCLPQGNNYQLEPSVGYKVGAFEGRSVFPPFTLNVGSKQCVSVQVSSNGVGPIIKLTNTVNCTSLAEYALEGAVCAAENRVLTNVTYVLNGGPAVVLCSGAGCGTAFNLGGLSLPLLPCANTLALSAQDDQGLSGSITFTVTRDSVPPTFTGCTDLVVVAQVSSNSTPVNYTVTASDACDASPRVTCVPPPGLFPPRPDCRSLHRGGPLR